MLGALLGPIIPLPIVPTCAAGIRAPLLVAPLATVVVAPCRAFPSARWLRHEQVRWGWRGRWPCSICGSALGSRSILRRTSTRFFERWPHHHRHLSLPAFSRLLLFVLLHWLNTILNIITYMCMQTKIIRIDMVYHIYWIDSHSHTQGISIHLMSRNHALPSTRTNGIYPYHIISKQVSCEKGKPWKFQTYPFQQKNAKKKTFQEKCFLEKKQAKQHSKTSWWRPNPS